MRTSILYSKEFSIILSTRAQKEVSQAWERYEDKKQGLRDRF